MLAFRTENLEMSFQMGGITVGALRGVSLDVEEGEFVSIVGTSGSGKSTLLNLVGGLMKPTRGKVYVKGEDLSRMDENHLALFRRQYIGFVFQSFNLVNTLTALENVELPLVFSNIGVSERDKRGRNCSKILDWKTGSPTDLQNCQEANSRGYPWPGQSLTIRKSFWQTNRQVIWIPEPLKRLWKSYTISIKKVRHFWWSLMIWMWLTMEIVLFI